MKMKRVECRCRIAKFENSESGRSRLIGFFECDRLLRRVQRSSDQEWSGEQDPANNTRNGPIRLVGANDS